MPDWITAHCLALYRTYRRFCPPYEALQQLHTTLELSRDDCRRKAKWAMAYVYNDAASRVETQLLLVEMRYGNLDRRQRYWLTGRLSKPTDHLLLCERIDGHIFLLGCYPKVGCAIRRGFTLLRETQWIEFRVIRPDNSLVVDGVTEETTLEQLYVQLAEH